MDLKKLTNEQLQKLFDQAKRQMNGSSFLKYIGIEILRRQIFSKQ